MQNLVLQFPTLWKTVYVYPIIIREDSPLHYCLSIFTLFAWWTKECP